MTTKMDSVDPIRFTEKLSDSINKLYKVGGLGLVFVFVGILAVIFAFIFPGNSLRIPMFIIGCILLVSSFILFLIIQYNGPIKTIQIIKDNKLVIDEIQDLSIKLTKLTYNTQSYCFKHFEQIKTIVDSFAPIVKPFLGEKGKTFVLKIDNISAGIVEYSEATEKIITDIKTALEKGDFNILKGYIGQLDALNAKFQTVLMEKK